MPQFFIKASDFDRDKAVIRDEDYHHLVNVRRVITGDVLRLRSEDGKGYTARITGIGKSEINLKIISETGLNPAIINISLYMALIKGGNFEFVIQKAVEVGVNRIIPIISSRTVPDPGKKIEEKHARWNKIIDGAAKQCFRSNMPEIDYPLPFPDIFGRDESAMKIIAHPGALTELHDYLSASDKPESVSIIIGPEGGFSDQEIHAASGKGWMPVNFGATHLRAETAAVILPSLLIYHWS